MKKKYEKCNIKAVKLDSEQAILQTCHVEGAYQNAGLNFCYSAGGYPSNCPVALRGNVESTTGGGGGSAENLPS